jgi:serine/threonine protein kinase/tetratricopeptide (TPR) repeat protein
MGEVYRARDARLGRDVAIKTLPERLAGDPQALARFEREMKAVAALSHPNLLAIFDTGTEQGVSYAVTELLEGETLRARLGRGALAWREAAEIADALAEGLEAAHSKGITHRDLKPENIWLLPAGRVKILDFGLARMDLEASAAAGAGAETRTEAGMILGSAGYMAPEQIRGAGVGPPSDLFALGCVLYEMVSGRRAFPGRTAAEIVSAILRDPPADLPASGSQIPPDLNRVIARCLEKEPRQRFQSAHEVGLQLRAALAAPAAASAPRAIDSIAVLPFTNSSQDPDAEYLCEGIAENILNSLAQLGQIRVTPRSTAFRHRSRDLDPQAIGRDLNVRVVVAGRVMARGENLIVGAELIDVAAGSQIWGERYNRKLSDIFALEEEIARRISESLRVKLTGEDARPAAKRSTQNTEAYQLYLRSRHQWLKRTPASLKVAVDYLRQAIDKDPGYALAYSGLADCYSILAIYCIQPGRDAWTRAKAAAASALAMDEDLSEAHNSAGWVRAFFDYDWAAADREFRRAAELNPNNWVTPYWHAFVLGAQGRLTEAEERVNQALAMEPLSAAIRYGAAEFNLMARRYSEAVDHCLRGIEIDPAYFPLRLFLGMSYLYGGRYEEALAEFETAHEYGGRTNMTAGYLALAYAVSGRGEAARLLEELEAKRAAAEPVDSYLVAVGWAVLGQTERALASLEQALEDRAGILFLFAKMDQLTDSLRPHPRYQAVLRRMRLA